MVTAFAILAMFDGDPSLIIIMIEEVLVKVNQFFGNIDQFFHCFTVKEASKNWHVQFLPLFFYKQLQGHKGTH